MSTVVQSPHAGLTHNTLVYASDDEYVETLAPFLEGGLRQGRPAIAVVPNHNIDLLTGALGSAAGAVQFFAAESWYESPARTIAGYDAFLSPLAGQRPHVIGEVNFGEREDDWPGWIRYESVLNTVLSHLDCEAVCPYDTRVLPPVLVEAAAQTHPNYLDRDGSLANDSYQEPETLLRSIQPTLREPAERPDLAFEVASSIRGARQTLASVLRSRGFAEVEVAESLLGINEILTNAIEHGGGRADVRVWFQGTGGAVIAVTDDGEGINDPFAGFRVPRHAHRGGRGLWLARQLLPCVELLSPPGGGLTVLMSAEPPSTSSP